MRQIGCVQNVGNPLVSLLFYKPTDLKKNRKITPRSLAPRVKGDELK